MTPEETRKIAERMVEQVWNQGEVEAADEVFAADFMHHAPEEPDLDGPAYKEWVAMNRTAFPDFRLVVDDLIVAEDRGAMRWTVTGTHTGDLVAPTGTVPPTGRPIAYSGVTLFRMAEDGLAELWHYADRITYMRQLGLMPEAAM
jgi:steroid delta-isomerase-like uncharacterized protein